MIRFDFDWSDTLNQTLLGLAFALLALQVWLLFAGHREVRNGRFVMKVLLNILLWISVLAFILQPYYYKNAGVRTVLLPAREVPSDFTQKLKDSLQISEVVNANGLENAAVDTLLLAGRDFGNTIFAKIMQMQSTPAVRWVPYFEPQTLHNMQWKGILRRGEMQIINGQVNSLRKQLLKARFGDSTLDSAWVEGEGSDFTLKFPAFVQGRTSVVLTLGETEVDTVHFFVRPQTPLTVRLAFESPDFESRNLAAWLGKNGYSVQYDAVLSKDLKASVNINKAKEPDLLITDTGKVKDALVKRTLDAGKSVLFINLSDAAAEILSINTALGTDFQLKKVSNEASLPISAELSALPYRFVASNRHFVVKGYPVSVQKKNGKIGVSFLTETFPMQLAGDSIGYERVWDAILSAVRPVSRNNINASAPLFAGIKRTIELNNFESLPSILRIGSDTVVTNISPLNPQTAFAEIIPAKTGWVSLPDSLELFVETDLVKATPAETRAFVNAYKSYYSSLKKAGSGVTPGLRKVVPAWFWFGLFILCFAALWIERKF